jgi:hypothetical protein
MESSTPRTQIMQPNRNEDADGDAETTDNWVPPSPDNNSPLPAPPPGPETTSLPAPPPGPETTSLPAPPPGPDNPSPDVAPNITVTGSNHVVNQTNYITVYMPVGAEWTAPCVTVSGNHNTVDQTNNITIRMQYRDAAAVDEDDTRSVLDTMRATARMFDSLLRPKRDTGDTGDTGDSGETGDTGEEMDQDAMLHKLGGDLELADYAIELAKTNGDFDRVEEFQQMRDDIAQAMELIARNPQTPEEIFEMKEDTVELLIRRAKDRGDAKRIAILEQVRADTKKIKPTVLKKLGCCNV